MELTEPWKSFDLPIEGAVVLRSTPDTLGVRFVAIPAEDFRGAHAALRARFVAAGWTAEDDNLPQMESTVLRHDGREVLLNTRVSDGRPMSGLTTLP